MKINEFSEFLFLKMLQIYKNLCNKQGIDNDISKKIRNKLK